ncbi:hypothetical protein ACJJI4_01255 [Microbulbifer sp. TRSA002]|uniref:hypothetical protein n=1 Tax=Microbulbifer sp. TRSA002 TaxID=3243382 RepID=UPI00403A4FF2
MSEASGLLVLKASDEIMDLLVCDEDDDGVHYRDVKALCDYAETGPVGMLSHKFYSLACTVEKRKEYIVVDAWVDGWLEIFQAIHSKGNNIEMYGILEGEYGPKIYFIVNRDGGRYIEHVNYEGNVNVDAEPDIEKKWLSMIPEDVLRDFPEILPQED